MPNEKEITQQQHTYRSAGDEDYELRYLAGKLDVSYNDIVEAIQTVGNERAKIAEYIQGR